MRRNKELAKYLKYLAYFKIAAPTDDELRTWTSAERIAKSESVTMEMTKLSRDPVRPRRCSPPSKADATSLSGLRARRHQRRRSLAF